MAHPLYLPSGFYTIRPFYPITFPGERKAHVFVEPLENIGENKRAVLVGSGGRSDTVRIMLFSRLPSSDL